MPSVVPTVPITLDRPRHLRFDRRAVFASEVELTRLWQQPRTFYSAMQTMMRAIVENEAWMLNLNDIAVLVWQGLRHEDPALTLEDTQELLPYLDLAAMVPICGALLEAWNVASQPAPGTTPAAQEAEDRDPLAASTGSNSGALSAVSLA
jgi:hypothetical protein